MHFATPVSSSRWMTLLWVYTRVNELVTIIINLAKKSKDILKMFAVDPFPFLSQNMRGHFCDVRACAMQDVINYDMVCDILPGDDVEHHSKARILNGSGSQQHSFLSMRPVLSHLFL